jgi:hypothetical protein
MASSRAFRAGYLRQAGFAGNKKERLACFIDAVPNQILRMFIKKGEEKFRPKIIGLDCVKFNRLKPVASCLAGLIRGKPLI